METLAVLSSQLLGAIFSFYLKNKQKNVQNLQLFIKEELLLTFLSEYFTEYYTQIFSPETKFLPLKTINIRSPTGAEGDVWATDGPSASCC